MHLYLDSSVPAGTVTARGSAIGPWGAYVTVWGVPSGLGTYNERYQDLGEALRFAVALPNAFAESPEAGAEAQDELGQQYVTDVDGNEVEIFSCDWSYHIGTIARPATPMKSRWIPSISESL